MEYQSFRELSEAFEAARSERMRMMADRIDQLGKSVENPDSVVARMMADPAFSRTMDVFGRRIAESGIDVRHLMTNKNSVITIICVVLAGYEAVTIDLTPSMHAMLDKVLTEIEDDK